MRKHDWLRVRFTRNRSMAAVITVVSLFALAFLGGSLVIDNETQVSGAPPGTVTGDAKNAASSMQNIALPMNDSDEVAGKPDEAISLDGELMPPLPKDPARRRAAIDKVKANAAANAGTPDVTYQAVSVAGLTQPEFSADLALRPAPEYRPTASEMKRFDDGESDDFELSAEVLAELGRKGTLDTATEAELKEILAQNLIQDFQGVYDPIWRPGSPDIAVSKDYVVLVVNSVFAVYDKSGTELHQASLSTLSSVASNRLNPRVLYDEWDDRWILSFTAADYIEDEAWVCLCVSATSEPMGIGAHWTYNYVWTNNGGYRADYIDLGCDPGAVYLVTDDLNWSNVFQRSRIACLDKAEIYVQAGSGREEFFAMTNPGDGTSARSICAAELNSYPGEYYLINSKRFGGSFITFWEITGSVAAPVLNGYNIPVGTYDNPPPIEQGDGTHVRSGDARLCSAKYYLSRLWTTHTQSINWGEVDDRSAIEIYVVNTPVRTLEQESGAYGASGYYYAYPAVDLDPLDRGIVVFARGGPSENMSIRYSDFTEGGSIGASSLLHSGESYYDDGINSGTYSSPFHWGNRFDCDIDRAGDFRTFWFCGQYASNDPDPSWDTWIGAASHESAPLLNVSPSLPFVSTGLEGGPFTPKGVTYTVENLGGSGLPWNLTGLIAWNTASITSGFVYPGGSVSVEVNVNYLAEGLSPGTYGDNYAFANSYTGSATTRTSQLTIGADGSCPGQIADLIPNTPPDYTSLSDDQDRGVYVTALKDFDVCAIGIEVDLELPQVINVQIYAADGTTRGALLASGSLTAVQPGQVVHYIPISYTLEACQEYDISVQFGAANSWDWWDEHSISTFDVGGVIRVRDGEYGGDASNFALLNFSIQGSAADCPVAADLDPDQGTTMTSSSNDDQERGLYIKADETVTLCSLGWRADLIVPQTITARVYEATGTTRGALVAEGTLDVSSTGMMFHDIPIGYVLEEGMEYDIAVEFGTATSWPYWYEAQVSQPYSVDAIRVVDAEISGDAANGALPHYRLGYTLGVAGVSFDLAKMNDVYPPTVTTSVDNSEYGAYVTSLIDQEVYSLSWIADIPEGEPIRARVYEATGITRGALLTEGEIRSSAPGTRWHQIPISVSLAAGTDYDIAVSFDETNEWKWWNDTTGLPYDSYGVIRVVDSERSGSASNIALPHLKMNACNVTATAIVGGPVQAPKFALMAPYPNPVSTSATIPFSLDESGPVTITVYDVLGRRVARILENDRRPAGAGEVRLNASNLATGVYFVKLEANQMSVSRKIAIVR